MKSPVVHAVVASTLCASLLGCSGKLDSVGSLEPADVDGPNKGDVGDADPPSPAPPAPAPASTTAPSPACAAYVRFAPKESAWFTAGDSPADYDIAGLVPGVARIASRVAAPVGFGTRMTTTDATPFRGQRVRLRGSVVAKDVSGWAGFWIRADDVTAKPVAFDNMHARPIAGTRVGAYETILTMPASAQTVSFGLLLQGAGDVLYTGVSIQTVSDGPYIADFRDGAALGDDPTGYVMTIDPSTSYCSRPSVHIQSKPTAKPGHFGTFMDTIAAETYRGKRIRLTGVAHTSNVKGWSALWMRVDRADQSVASFDNMQNRPITGTTTSQAYNVVLDVPADAAQIAFGGLLSGQGDLWIERATIDVVDATVPPTAL